MYLLKTTITFCVFSILIKNNVNCDNSDEKFFKTAHIHWIPEDKQRFSTLSKFETVKTLKDVVPEEVNAWGAFSVQIDYYIQRPPVLWKESITDIKNLTSIDLSVNQVTEITAIEPGAFRNLPQLQNLSLARNELTHIEPGTFANLTISVLDLSSNKIAVLQPGVFQFLPNLKVLILSRNSLQTLSDGVLHEAFNLQDLQLSENQLSKIDPKIFENLHHLTNLQLDFNYLTELNCNMLKFPQMNHLNISHNSISKLDSGCFKNLPLLREHDLRQNQLVEIPEGLFNYSEIVKIDLRHNNISVIAFNAFDIPTLRYLAIDNNKLTTWDNRWLRSTPRLLKMSAAANQIEELPDEVLDYGSYINFENNVIKRISPNAFRNLKIIDYLNLENNKLENWDSNLLKNITVHRVNVQNNQLQCVHGDLEKAFGGAEHVQLFNGNPWRPDCQMKMKDFQYSNRLFHLWSYI